jgi:hypothetical protein
VKFFLCRSHQGDLDMPHRLLVDYLDSAFLVF